MVKRILVTLFILGTSLLLVGCLFLSPPAHTNPFDPTGSPLSCSATLVGTNVSISWSKTTLADLKAYYVINSVSEDDIRNACVDFTTGSNASIVIRANVPTASLTNQVIALSGLNMTVPQYFAVIYRAPKSAKGSTIATIQP